MHHLHFENEQAVGISGTDASMPVALDTDSEPGHHVEEQNEAREMAPFAAPLPQPTPLYPAAPQATATEDIVEITGTLSHYQLKDSR